MEIIPAIDIRGGKAVRLYQGDFARETVFAEDPVQMARHWVALGAPRLHVVDLDGAREGRPVHLGIVAALCAAVEVPVQVGGGLRTLEALQEARAAEAHRLVLGTAALREPDLVRRACDLFGDAVVVSIDAREGWAAAGGWREASQTRAADLLGEMELLGVARFIYTDIARDGTLEGPNLEALREVLARARMPVIASGGVSTLDDIRRLAALGVEGAIVGQALYTGRIELPAALAAATPSWEGMGS